MSLGEHGNSADFMRRAKYNGSTAPSHVQTRVKGGGFSTAPKDILQGLHGTFVDWYAPRKAGPGGGPRGGRLDVGDLYATLPVNQLECVAYSVSAKEFARALASAPSKSCPGPTGISVPLLKKFPPAYLDTLRTMFNLILAWGLLPAVFNEGFIFPIPKKGVFSPDNCRPISLLEAHLKLLTRIVNRRLVYALLDADYFAEEQFGFLCRAAPALTPFTFCLELWRMRRNLTKKFMSPWWTLQRPLTLFLPNLYARLTSMPA